MALIKESEVTKIFKECLFGKEDKLTDEEKLSKGVTVSGINLKIVFNPDKLKANEAKIISFIDNILDDFDDGYSFTLLGVDKYKNPWTSSQMVMQELMCLGIAINKLKYCIETRDMWNLLPGGMPYLFRL